VRLQAGVRTGDNHISVVPKDENNLPDVAVSLSAPSGKIERARDAEERRRLFYVAMTRARDRLYLSAEVEEGKRPGGTSFEKLLPLSLQQTIESGLPAAGHERVTWNSSSGASFTFKVCLPDDAAYPVASEPLTSTGTLDTKPLADNDLPRTTATKARGNNIGSYFEITPDVISRVSSRELGTLVHRMFQHQVDTDDPDAARAWAAALIRPDDAGDGGSDPSELAARAAEMYRAMRSRDDVTSALASGTCYYEVPFSVRVTGPDGADRIIRGQIDAVVVPDRGPLRVIEFKTGQPQPEHEAQVEIYRQALASAWPGREVSTSLFYF